MSYKAEWISLSLFIDNNFSFAKGTFSRSIPTPFSPFQLEIQSSPTVINFNRARLASEAVAVVKPEQVRRAAQPQFATLPLKGYLKIWERNLFNIPEKTPSAPKKEVSIEKIALANKVKDLFYDSSATMLLR